MFCGENFSRRSAERVVSDYTKLSKRDPNFMAAFRLMFIPAGAGCGFIENPQFDPTIKWEHQLPGTACNPYPVRISGETIPAARLVVDILLAAAEKRFGLPEGEWFDGVDYSPHNQMLMVRWSGSVTFFKASFEMVSILQVSEDSTVTDIAAE